MIADFHNTNGKNPAPDPYGYMAPGQNLQKGCHCKAKIRSCIQFGAKFADGPRLSGNGSIDHICQSTKQVEAIKPSGKWRTKQHTDAAYYADSCDKICNLFFHCCSHFPIENRHSKTVPVGFLIHLRCRTVPQHRFCGGGVCGDGWHCPRDLPSLPGGHRLRQPRKWPHKSDG